MLLTNRTDHGSSVDAALEALPMPAAELLRSSPRRDLVARVTNFLRNNLGDPVTVAELSHMVGVSERTLRAAFHDVIGISPKQYAISQRLRAAREALSAATPGTATVTGIAMEYGFFELGRFAKRYRDAFGEVPSETLQHVDVPWPAHAA